MEILEIIATLTGIIAVSLQTKEKIIAWPFAIISVAISAYIFFDSKLYSDFGLHIIYIFLNIYGWYHWSNSSNNQPAPIYSLTLKNIVRYTFILLTSALLLGYIMQMNTDADLPYFDAFTTTGSLLAQYLLAKKYLQNWLLWIIVDIVAIPIYLYKGLYYFSFLFFIYLIICIFGYVTWNKKYNYEYQ